jgi:hypothetical protein
MQGPRYPKIRIGQIQTVWERPEPCFGISSVCKSFQDSEMAKKTESVYNFPPGIVVCPSVERDLQTQFRQIPKTIIRVVLISLAKVGEILWKRLAYAPKCSLE